MPSSTLHASRDGSANGFKMPRTKNLPRPTTWFTSNASGSSQEQGQPISDSMGMRHTPLGATSSSSSSGSNGSSSSGSTLSGGKCTRELTLTASPGNPFAVPFRNPKHRLSPSPSPHKGAGQDEDFVMISPVRSTHLSPHSRMISEESSSPIEDSPTPACGMANAAARLRLADEDSPIRRVPGMSRSLASGRREGGGPPPSPLKFASGNLSVMPLSDGEGSPGLPETPMLGDDRPPPQPLFPLPRSNSQELRSRAGQSMFAPSKPVRSGEESKIPRLSASHPLRARASTGSQMDHEKSILGQKKAISLDRIPTTLDKDEAFGSVAAPPSALGHARRTSKGQLGAHNRHKRINSGEGLSSQTSISRSTGHKSGLSLSLGGLPDFSYSNSSLSSLSTNNMTPPASTFSPAEPPIFEDVKPLQEAFEQPSTALRKFKPRDSGVSVGSAEDDKLKIPPPSVLRPGSSAALGGNRPRRPPMLKRTSSMGDQGRPLETPIEPTHSSGWPGATAFTFLGEGGLALATRKDEDEKPSMPDTPVKKNHFASGTTAAGRRGMGHSSSQPSLGSSAAASMSGFRLDDNEHTKGKMPPPTMRKKGIPQLTLTGVGSSSPDGDSADGSSPTVRAAAGMMLGGTIAGGANHGGGKPGRVGLLRRMSNGGSGSESEGTTPTKDGGEKVALAAARPDLILTPSKPSATAPQPLRAPIGQSTSTAIYPRLSLPAFANPKVHRTLHHRQSHPASKFQEDEDIFESRFIVLDTLGKGAFSTVVKVQERVGDGLYAVKKARGVFDGVRDRLRHLEEVDILRHLSSPSNPHVLRFSDAWEQNRQLFIQTELCLGTLAFFLEEYGRVVERLDEGRVWKIVRELSDGIRHIHSSGVVHFDLKPANILISDVGTLKIGDFGMASRYPRISPAAILEGSGLGGGGTNNAVLEGMSGWEKIEREGDRVYMPPEMLRGVFGMPADIFSFGLVVLEVSTNICVPDGGPAWHSLRTDDFTVVDLSPLSPALADLIMNCMAADPAYRPTSHQVVNHPVIVRARTGGAALAPESKEWLADVLGGYGFVSPVTGEGDVEMEG